MYSFCKEFGWTIQEFYQQPKRELEQFAVILSEISAIQAQKQRESESKMRRR